MSTVDPLVIDSQVEDKKVLGIFERWKEVLNFILSYRFDDSKSSTIGAGTGTVKMSSANNANNSQWIPMVYNGTTYWIPAWTTNSP